ncbi:DNA polymerase eta [Diachasma alloeum]|uniref:DNA polymerase eta n=1 Tax=Diachasma alloeum TaxID=454923 RepID=UPI00073833FC|nr:DNA polymerase eta [Diachasma alloeum]
MANLGDRIVVLIDMDCFFCQVEAKLQPELKGKPLAVIQYSSFGPSSIIAVNYEARDYGVTRHMKGPEAKEKCPDIVLVTVPPLRNKPDTGRYRSAGREVIDVLKKQCSIIERASIDEAYLDITSLVEERMDSAEQSPERMIGALSNTFVVGYCDDDSNDEGKRAEGVERWVSEAFGDLGDVQARKLAIAGMLVEEFRAEIWSQCEYRCSAGISYNKILAKLACGLHKPNKQTILPTAAVTGLYSSLPVKKVRNLGGKFGNIVMESLGCNVMADLLKYSLQDLRRRFDDKTGSWLYNIARGIDNEPVTNRLICKSIGSSKNFPGKAAITKLEDLKGWVTCLAEEIVDRLEQDMEENERRATHLTLSYHWYQDKKVVTQSKSCSLTSYKIDRIVNMCVDVITKATQKPIAFIGMSAGKFIAVKGSGNFVNFFKSGGKPENLQVKPDLINQSKYFEPNSENSLEVKSSDFPQNEENSLDSNVKFEESDVKTYTRKRDGTEHKAELENNLSNLFSSKEERNNHAKITLPEVTDQKPNLLLSFDISKCPLDSDDFKNSFFLNFLKDSRSTPVQSLESKPLKESANAEMLESNSLDKCDIESPDLFDDCEIEGQPELEGQPEPYKETFPSSNVKDNEKQQVKAGQNEDNSALAKLKDIFPDLNNIDTSVLQLLPIQLQRAADAYLKLSKTSSVSTSTNKNDLKTIAKARATKSKSTTTKLPPKKTGIIKNFFVNNSSNHSTDSPKKQCPECKQMIIMTKFQEHCDFHVAENLQRIINNSLNSEVANSTGEDRSSNLQSPVAKRKLSIETPQPNKKPRNIQSFFT